MGHGFVGKPSGASYKLGRLNCAEVRRGQHNLGPLIRWKFGKPVDQGKRLLLAKIVQGDIDIALGDIDAAKARRVGEIARDMAGALPVADNPKARRPARLHVAPNVAPTPVPTIRSQEPFSCRGI